MILWRLGGAVCTFVCQIEERRSAWWIVVRRDAFMDLEENFVSEAAARDRAERLRQTLLAAGFTEMR